MRMRERVVVYVTRTAADGKTQVLAFVPDDVSILLLPAGGVDPGETAEAAAVREVFEETGLTVAHPRRLTSTMHRYSAHDVWCVQHFMRVAAPADLPESWSHVVTGQGVETGRTFRLRWIDARRLDHVAGAQSAAAYLLNRTPAAAKPTSATIRPATPDDVEPIRTIRNGYVDTSTAIYTTEHWSSDEARQWFEDRDVSVHPITVAEIDGKLAGYGSLSRFDFKCGYAATAEDSVYVAPGLHGRGIGGALLGDLIRRGQVAGLRTIVARIDSGQPASLGLHLRHAFDPVGILREAGFKFDAWRDVVYLQRLLRDQ